MRFLASYSIGTKLLVTPTMVTGLLILVAAAAYYGLWAQHEALQSIYETRFQRLRETSEGIDLVRSVNEDVHTALSEYRKTAKTAKTDDQSFDILKEQADSIRSGLADAIRALDAQATQEGVDAEERAAYAAVLESVRAYSQELEQPLKMVSGQIDELDESYYAMVWHWFDGFLNTAGQLNDIQDRLSREDYAAATRIATTATTLLGAAVLLALIVSVVSALAIRAQIVGAVNGIRDAALRLQSGDLTGRVEVVGRDEVAQSAQAFNQLVEGFQHLVKNVLDGAHEVATSARGLAADAQEAQRGAARQSEATEAVARTMEEMSVSIMAVADGAEQVRASSQRSLDGAQAGKLALEQMRAEMDLVQASFAEIRASVEDFLKRTAAIAGLTHQVKEIAQQTNLLALNAAIEAARAGDQGRGFAVVADEVRKLAEHSAGAANHIDDVAGALGARSAAVGQSLLSGHQALVSTLEQLDALQHVVSAAGEAVATTTREIDGIADVVRGQSSGSSEIARNVDAIASMCEQNARVVIEAAGAAARLERLAVDLEASVVRFRA